MDNRGCVRIKVGYRNGGTGVIEPSDGANCPFIEFEQFLSWLRQLPSVAAKHGIGEHNNAVSIPQCDVYRAMYDLGFGRSLLSGRHRVSKQREQNEYSGHEHLSLRTWQRRDLASCGCHDGFKKPFPEFLNQGEWHHSSFHFVSLHNNATMVTSPGIISARETILHPSTTTA
jgi:hypothetical protein